MYYLELLARLHEGLSPDVYLEIGVRNGDSLALSRSRSIGIDPDPRPTAEAVLGKPWLKLYATTSDEFFARHHRDESLDGGRLDLALIDGLHEFGQVVRDLGNVERWGHADTVVVIHDVLPESVFHATRTFHEGGWSADVWRIVPFLQTHRRDLTCRLVDAGDGVVLLVTGMNPGHEGMLEAAVALERDCSSGGSECDAVFSEWLLNERLISPTEALRSLTPAKRSIAYQVSNHRSQMAGSDGKAFQIPTRIVFDEAMRGSYRASLELSARGMDVLRLRLHSDGPTSPAHHDILLDVTYAGAIHHEMDALRFHSDRKTGTFSLNWESSLALGESMQAMSIDAMTFELHDAAPSDAMNITLHELRVQQILWPREGGRFAPERFPELVVESKRRNGKRDAVVFAWWVPDTAEGQKVGEYYLGLLKYHHPDSKLFIGINHGCDLRWDTLLRTSGLDVEIGWARPEIGDYWDVSGFLTALEVYSSCTEEFDLVWFGHTKGASGGSYSYYTQYRFQHDRRFWSRRTDIDEMFVDPRIGLFCQRYGLHDVSADVPWRGTHDLDALSRIYRDRYAPLGLWAWETVFVLRNEVVREFCGAVGPGFFGTAPGEYGAGRWWFEAAFPSIASMQGYEPLIEMHTDGEGNPRDDVALHHDPKQGNRIAMNELIRWRQNPFDFQPHGLSKVY